MIVEQQLNSRTADSPPPPPESGAEASAVETRYLKSIGKPLSPPNDSMNSGAGGSGASGGYGGASTGLTGP